jgi:hypothetical protein
MGNPVNFGGAGDPGDADPSLGGGAREQVYRLAVRAVDSARECLAAGAPAEEFECVILGNDVVHRALRSLLDGISVAAERQPVDLGTLERAMLGVLVSAGVPGSAMHRALGHTPREEAERLRAPEAFAARLTGPVAERRQKLHAAVTAAQKAYTRRLDRAAGSLPPSLLRIYRYLRGVAGWRPLRLYRDGAAWGYSGPLIVLGLLPYQQEEYYFSLDPLDQEVLVLGKLPRWPGEFPDLRISLQDALIFARLSMFVCGHAWSEDPFAGGAAWAEAAERWDAWAAAEPDPDVDSGGESEGPI